MLCPLHFEPLQASHLDELATVLLHAPVYEHIEANLPDVDRFKQELILGIAGPGPEESGQTWLNYLVRNGIDGSMLGRLESTVRNSIAEVAFLFGPQNWGKGYASRGLIWLQAEVLGNCGVNTFWAATTPANTRSQALLLRNGYSPVKGNAPFLLSYEPGDLVFCHQSAA